MKPRKLSSTLSDASLLDLRQHNPIEDAKDLSQFATPPTTPLTPTTLNEEIFTNDSSMANNHKFEKPLSHHHHPQHPHFQRKLSSANVTLPLQQVYAQDTSSSKAKANPHDELEDEIKPLNVKKNLWLKRVII